MFCIRFSPARSFSLAFEMTLMRLPFYSMNTIYFYVFYAYKALKSFDYIASMLSFAYEVKL